MGCNDVQSHMMDGGGDPKIKSVLNCVLKLTNYC